MAVPNTWSSHPRRYPYPNRERLPWACSASEPAWLVGGALHGWPERGLHAVPGVLEGFDLRLAGVALGGLEEEVVVPLGIKGRVEVDEVHGLGGEAVAQDLEVVAVVEV